MHGYPQTSAKEVTVIVWLWSSQMPELACGEISPTSEASACPTFAGFQPVKGFQIICCERIVP
jgi:hypothetical protein